MRNPRLCKKFLLLPHKKYSITYPQVPNNSPLHWRIGSTGGNRKSHYDKITLGLHEKSDFKNFCNRSIVCYVLLCRHGLYKYFLLFPIGGTVDRLERNLGDFADSSGSHPREAVYRENQLLKTELLGLRRESLMALSRAKRAEQGNNRF